MGPGGRMKAETRTAVSVDQELLKVPGNVIHSDRVVDEFISLADLVDGLRAGILQELVERMMVSSVYFDLSVDMQITVWFPAISWAHM